jgi:hypothetical protein
MHWLGTGDCPYYLGSLRRSTVQLERQGTCNQEGCPNSFEIDRSMSNSFNSHQIIHFGETPAYRTLPAAGSTPAPMVKLITSLPERGATLLPGVGS